MKKYFTKIIVITLLFGIFTMTSSLCFQGLLGSLAAARPAEAASVEAPVAEVDACGVQHVQHPVKPVAPKAAHHNTVLPCCVDGGHSDIVSFFKSVEPAKVVPVILSTIEYLPKTVIEIVAYHSPLISPPELSAVRTTILRV